MSYHWLDANGLALYLRDAVRTSHLDSCLPGEVLARFDQNCIDNRARVARQLRELTTVDQGFREAGIRYAVLKGFTLEPDFCRDSSLRYQCDLDLVVRRADRQLCRGVLKKLGYRVTSEQPDALELKPAEEQIPTIAELYKPRKQQAIEIHFVSNDNLGLSEECLDHICLTDRHGYSFPGLAQLDAFYLVVIHLYRHLLSEWTRLSWFYEFAWFLSHRASDGRFWDEVNDRVEADEHTAQALALVLAFSKQAFTENLPEPLEAVCQSNLSESAHRWILQYGRDLLFSDFPGNKLYLLLLREINADENGWGKLSIKRLLPLHPPARALYGDTWAERLRNIPGNASYGWTRAGFHVREGFRYVKEQWRWKRKTGQAAWLESGSE